jgi:hypothetical protein
VLVCRRDLANSKHSFLSIERVDAMDAVEGTLTARLHDICGRIIWKGCAPQLLSSRNPPQVFQTNDYALAGAVASTYS